MAVSAATVNFGQAIRDILRTQLEYTAALPDDWGSRVLGPACLTRKISLLCDKRAFVIWFSPDYPPDGLPDGREFLEEGPVVWIVDVVAMPGVDSMRLGREISTAMFLHAGVKDKGRVLFWRWPKGRYGFIRARNPRRTA